MRQRDTQSSSLQGKQAFGAVGVENSLPVVGALDAHPLAEPHTFLDVFLRHSRVPLPSSEALQ